MKAAALVGSFVLAVVLPAQDSPAPKPAAAAKSDPASERLAKQLRTAARATSAEFEAAWKWPLTVSGTATTTRSGGSRVETASGRFCPDGLLVKYDNSRLGTVQVLHVGRHKLSQENNGPWRFDALGGVRVIRISYVPDPQQLLMVLASAEPKVCHREIIEVDGRPIERVGCTLTGEQMDLLTRAGVLSDPDPSAGFVRRVRQANLRGVKVPETAGSPVDVVVEFDVATKNVMAVRMRCVSKAVDMRAMVERMRLRGRGRGADEQEESEEAEPKQQPKPKNAEPVRFENGMPVRKTEGMNVYTVELTMRKHGQLPALELSDEQKKLLGR